MKKVTPQSLRAGQTVYVIWEQGEARAERFRIAGRAQLMGIWGDEWWVPVHSNTHDGDIIWNSDILKKERYRRSFYSLRQARTWYRGINNNGRLKAEWLAQSEFFRDMLNIPPVSCTGSLEEDKPAYTIREVKLEFKGKVKIMGELVDFEAMIPAHVTLSDGTPHMLTSSDLDNFEDITSEAETIIFHYKHPVSGATAEINLDLNVEIEDD